jgi:putative endonuclease
MCHSERSQESLCYDFGRERLGSWQAGSSHENLPRLDHVERVTGSLYRRDGDLLRRVAEHKQKKLPGLTSRYCATELVYFEAFVNIRAAISREKQIKGWLRARKIALVESFNPHWKDFSADLQTHPQPKAQRDSSLRSE